MTTWWGGRRRLTRARDRAERSLDEALGRLGSEDGPVRVPGCAVFLTHDLAAAPLALRAMVEQNRALHERVVLLGWSVVDTPAGPEETWVEVDRLDDRHEGVVAVRATFGYREAPDVVRVLARAREQDPERLESLDPGSAVFFVSVPIPLFDPHGDMARWRQRLFLLLDRLAGDPVDQLRLPRDRTIMLGREVTL
jgi:KUP system potassium uptake protein